MEAICDPAVGLHEDGVLTAHAPITRKCPLIERQRWGRRVGVNLILVRATRRGEVLGAISADVRLGGFDIGHVGGGLDAFAGDRDGARRDVSMACLTQELLDYVFGLGVVALAEMMGTNATIGVDDVVRGQYSLLKPRQIA
jgi:hypothetical protein